MAEPITAFVSVLLAGTTTSNSGSLTATFTVTGYEAFIPVIVVTPNTGISAGAQVQVYRSTDGGATYETQATVAAAFPATSNINMMKTANLQTGQYAIRIMVGGAGAGTWSVAINTIMVITAYS